MKALKTILEASILGDIESTLNKNVYTILYPAPTIKDFKKPVCPTDGKTQFVDWQCKDLIQKYIGKISDISSYKNLISDATGLRCWVYSDKCISTSIIDKHGYKVLDLDGIGDWVSNNLRDTKKACIEFLEKLSNNPEALEKIFLQYNKNKVELLQYGVCDCINYDKLV